MSPRDDGAASDDPIETAWRAAVQVLSELYGDTPDFTAWLARLRTRVVQAAEARSADLVALDRRRRADPHWFQAPDRTGYTGYIDRFVGRLDKVEPRLDYLKDLGVTYLHPLPISRPRAGDSDGGFAVADYLDVDPRLGTFDDLKRLCDTLRQRDISLVVDVVCNHTADDHAWAVAARAGDTEKRGFYHVLADRDEVDAYAQTLVDVFPDAAPGSFTYVEALQAWVWTTFYPFQWDLNYANPAVFEAMTDVLLQLANAGVQGFRLDSAPFLWKRQGTSCRGLPQTHLIVQAWRALLSIAAPSVLLKAEAIERLDDVLAFFGPNDGGAGPGECQLAYNNAMMAALWAALATGDVAIARQVIADAERRPERGAWLNYIRCHDDVIWNALLPYASPEALAALSSFYAGDADYAGDTEASFARGERFQNLGDGGWSVNGMAADLAGLPPDAPADHPAVARLQLLYGVMYALDGVPLLYMGDEIGLVGDPSYRADPDRAGDGRWLHRPQMDWELADRRTDASTAAGALFATLAHLGRLRGGSLALNALDRAQPIETSHPAILGFSRARGGERVICLANFASSPLNTRLTNGMGNGTDMLTGDAIRGDAVALGAFQVRWVQGVG